MFCQGQGLIFVVYLPPPLELSVKGGYRVYSVGMSAPPPLELFAKGGENQYRPNCMAPWVSNRPIASSVAPPVLSVAYSLEYV